MLCCLTHCARRWPTLFSSVFCRCICLQRGHRLVLFVNLAKRKWKCKICLPCVPHFQNPIPVIIQICDRLPSCKQGVLSSQCSRSIGPFMWFKWSFLDLLLSGAVGFWVQICWFNSKNLSKTCTLMKAEKKLAFCFELFRKFDTTAGCLDGPLVWSCRWLMICKRIMRYDGMCPFFIFRRLPHSSSSTITTTARSSFRPSSRSSSPQKHKNIYYQMKSSILPSFEWLI